MQIKLTLIIIFILIALSSIGTVTAVVSVGTTGDEDTSGAYPVATLTPVVNGDEDTSGAYPVATLMPVVNGDEDTSGAWPVAPVAPVTEDTSGAYPVATLTPVVNGDEDTSGAWPVAPIETVKTPAYDVGNYFIDTPKLLIYNLSIVESATPVKTSIKHVTEHTKISTCTSLTSTKIYNSREHKSAQNHINQTDTTTSIKRSIYNVPNNTKPINETGIPSAAFVSGIFMLIGGIVLPKNQ